MNSVLACTGEHLLADFYGVLVSRLRDGHALELLLRRAASLAGARVLSSHFHRFGEAGGVTGVVILAESHISIHTWPESGFAAIDIFMCGSARPAKALEQLRLMLEPARQSVHAMRRGLAEAQIGA